MSLEEFTRRTTNGGAGKLLLSTAIGALMAISGATLHTVYVDHSKQLAGISQQIADLVIANEDRTRAEDERAKVTNDAIAKLADNEQQHSLAVALAQREIEDLQHTSTPRYDRNITPPLVGPVVDALSHILPQPRGHRRRP